MLKYHILQRVLYSKYDHKNNQKIFSRGIANKQEPLKATPVDMSWQVS